MSSKRSLQILALLKTANENVNDQEIENFSKNETEEQFFHTAGKLLLPSLIFYFEFIYCFSWHSFLNIYFRRISTVSQIRRCSLVIRSS